MKNKMSILDVSYTIADKVKRDIKAIHYRNYFKSFDYDFHDEGLITQVILHGEINIIDGVVKELYSKYNNLTVKVESYE